MQNSDSKQDKASYEKPRLDREDKLVQVAEGARPTGPSSQTNT